MDGQRTKKIVTDPSSGTTTTTEYFYNGSILAGQKTGNDEIVFMYDNNGDVFGFTYNGAPYYYIKNAQNDVYLIIDENGYAQVLYQYDAWGKVTYCLDATDFGLAGKNPIMYRSCYVDLEMGMFIYYLNSRYYIADWGRFASADVLVSSEQGMLGYNLFAYCGNNPVNRSDTGGAFWDTLFDVVSLCTSIVDVMSNPKDPWAWAGLVGDVFDLAVPYVSGVGEVIKGARTAGKVVDGISAVGNTARKVNNLGDAGKTVSKVVKKGTQNSKVKAAIQRGQAMHKQMDYGPGVLKEKTIAPRCRVDGIDLNNKIIYELKPNNPQAISRGKKQLDRYTEAANQVYGGNWVGVLVLYD